MEQLIKTRPVQERHLPKSFRHVRLELAREPRHPGGDSGIGYLLWVPIGRDGKIDAGLWREFRDFYRVLKFRRGANNEIGHVVHRQGGSWAFHYDIAGDDQDETGFHLKDEKLEPGEYISIREGKNTRVYQVVTVEPY